MEVSLIMPEVLYIPDSLIKVFIIALLAVIGWEISRCIIIDNYSLCFDRSSLITVFIIALAIIGSVLYVAYFHP